MADFPVGSVELIRSGVMTQLMLMLPGVRLGTGVRPFQGHHGRLVWIGAGRAWAYVWPDETVTCGGDRALRDALAHAYQQLQETGFPNLDTFTLEAGPDHASYRVACPAVGQLWEHHVSL